MEDRKQEILTFVTFTRDHAAVWTFIEIIPNESAYVSLPQLTHELMQTRDGKWYRATRDLFNTLTQAEHSVVGWHYEDATETVVYFDHVKYLEQVRSY